MASDAHDPAAIASFTGPVAGGRGISLLSAVGTRHLPGLGYVEEEYFAHGDAWSYRPVPGAEEFGRDGRWSAEPAVTAPYRTRVIVRRPVDPDRANGTLLLEWHNVTSGMDACPDWTFLEAEIVRGGYTWVGVSAQQVGVSGGASIVGLPDSGGLRGTDPERYGSLDHPGDAFAYGIYTQIGRALAAPGGTPVLGGVVPDRVLAVGESQSAFRLAGYVNAVHPLEQFFDGFLIHSRGAGAAMLGDETRLTDIGQRPVLIRDDLDAPVLIVATETDIGPVLRYYDSRQADTATIRTWEIAGAAHADVFMLGGHHNLLGCTHLMNEGPQHFVLKAALRHLDQWARGTDAPPRAARLTAVEGPAVVRDGLGNALGGIRTPLVDVPVASLSGEPADCANPLCVLFGTTVPMSADEIRARYPSWAAYLGAYGQAADDAIAAGFVLAEDRAELLAAAETHVPAGAWPDRNPT